MRDLSVRILSCSLLAALLLAGAASCKNNRTIDPGDQNNPQYPPIQNPPTQGIPALDVNAPPNAVFKITDYGNALQLNKISLASATDTAGANAQEKALVLAIAMQETTHMGTNERDASKDNTASANVTMLNMNYDFVRQLGYQGSDNGASLNNPAALTVAVGYMLQALRTWGPERTLNFHRGGATAFQDGVSYGAAGYRSAIATIYNCIAADPALEGDGRRVEIDVPGQ